MLKDYGFNGTGAWSDFDLMRETPSPLVYTIIINPMGAYKSDHIKKFGGKYEMAGWQGYRYDLAMVFDPEFDSYVEKAIAPIAKYSKDKYLLGYYSDNELPWKNDALDRHIKYLGKEEAGYIAAKKWLDIRKGKDASLEDITEEDCIHYMMQLVIDRTFDGYMTEIKTVYGQLEKELGINIEPASDEWDRHYNVDFFIKVGDKFIGIQIKPINQGIQLSQIFKEKDLQLKSHESFTKQYGGKVFYIFSSKVGDKKEIRNKEVIDEIKQEIERLEE